MSFAVCLLYLALRNSSFAAEPAKIPFPPVIQENVRWQQLPWQYDDVFVDHEQKPWFHMRDGYRSVIDRVDETGLPRERMTCLVSPELPNDVLEIPPGNKRLGFDRQGRFWEIGRYGLAATNPRKGSFEQHAAMEPLTDKAASATKHAERPFVPFMFEHSTGRLYFIDFFGIHCLDGKVWTTHRFIREPRDNSLENVTHILRASEAPDGRFFLWSSYPNWLDALFIHDGDKWSQITVQEEPRLDELQEIRPQDDGTIQLRSPSGGNFELEALNRKREVAYPVVPELAWNGDRGPRAGDDASLATDGPLSVHGIVRGGDGQGRVYIRGLGHAGLQVVIYNPHIANNDLRLPVEIVRLNQSDGWQPTIEDSQGRIWSRWQVDQKPFLSRYSKGEWTHFPTPLLLGEPPLPVDDTRMLAKYQMSWVMRPNDAADDWKPDKPACFEGLPGMANTALIQPLAGDAVVAQEQRNSDRSYFFDGQRWTVYRSPYELVETHYDLLREQLTNTSPASGNEDYCWGRDALGRIWIQGYVYEPAQAYDGKTWQKLPFRFFQFDREGRRCLSEWTLYDTTVDPPKNLGKVEPFAEKVIEPFIHLVRSDSRVWHVGDTLPNGAKLPEEFLRNNSKYGIMEDAAGRYWFEDVQSLWVVRFDGAAARLDREAAHFYRVLAQQSADVFWAAATDGLIQIRLHDKPGEPLRLEQMNHYPRNVPQGATGWMAIDDSGDLWISCQNDAYALCRVKLPPLNSSTPLPQERK